MRRHENLSGVLWTAATRDQHKSFTHTEPGRKERGRWNVHTYSLVQQWCRGGLKQIRLSAFDPLFSRGSVWLCFCVFLPRDFPSLGRDLVKYCESNGRILWHLRLGCNYPRKKKILTRGLIRRVLWEYSVTKVSKFRSIATQWATHWSVLSIV